MNTEKDLFKTIDCKLHKKSVRIGNYNINYVVAGSGKPIVLVHGGNIGIGQWYPNISELAKHHIVYALDLPGGGRSSRVDFAKINLETDYVNVLHSFIHKLNIKKPTLIGSSVGGWMCLKIALRNEKLDKLVLSDSLGFTDYMAMSDRIIGIYPLAMLLSKTVLKPSKDNKNIEKFLMSVFADSKFPIRREFVDYFYETMQTSHNLQFISSFSSFFGVRKEFLLEEKLGLVKTPTLIIWGKEDKLMPLEHNIQNFGKIKNSEVKILNNAGHIPSIEKAALFNKTVLKFLR